MDISYMIFDGKRSFDPENFVSRKEESGLTKKTYHTELKKNMESLSHLQDKLYAYDKYGVLLIFQAMDAAGKDSMIKNVMRGVNPQGTQVYSFKKPSTEELDHDYLWRYMRCLPERGRIGIFNRSYYEDVLVAKVHNLPAIQNKLPKCCLDDIKPEIFWERRYRQIRDFERYLAENGIIVLKFFLNVSKEKQKERFLKRIENPDKNWKFSSGDIEERGFWEKYQKAYKMAINETATEDVPWYVIPADSKWYARLAVSEIIVNRLKKCELKYPELSTVEKGRLNDYKKILLKEE